jgi:hypothetical protein
MEGNKITKNALANINATMQRQKRSKRELARLLQLTDYGTHHRLNGSMAFRLNEIEQIAAWLEISAFDLLRPSHTTSKEDDIAVLLTMSPEQRMSFQQHLQQHNVRSQHDSTTKNEEEPAC